MQLRYIHSCRAAKQKRAKPVRNVTDMVQYARLQMHRSFCTTPTRHPATLNSLQHANSEVMKT